MDILFAALVLGGMGLLFGGLLTLTSKVFAVPSNPTRDAVRELLPGANCGGCGYPGCGGYAEAVLKGEAPIGKCASGGNECAQAMAAIMGVKAEAMIRKVALVRCSGFRSVDESGKELGAKLKGQYEGFHDCVAASKVGGNGPLSCKFGCLGYGTCTKACKYDALHVVDGVAKVDSEKCVGCMACTQVCPRKIIVPVEYDKHVRIACASHAKGAVTVRGCTQGCIGCSICVKVCPKDAISIDKNLAVIDYSKCDSCGLCATVCPKKLIVDTMEGTPEEIAAAAKK